MEVSSWALKKSERADEGDEGNWKWGFRVSHPRHEVGLVIVKEGGGGGGGGGGGEEGEGEGGQKGERGPPRQHQPS